MSDSRQVPFLRRLSNGFTLPAIGYGTYPNTDALLESIPAAIRYGCRLIDSSDNYGDERIVGEGLRRSGALAKDVIVISKFSQPKRTFELESCYEESERSLHHRIDVYLLHWPYPHLWKEQWRRMEHLYLDGRCSAIGVCNFEEDKIDELLKFCEVPPMVNQVECHPLFQQGDLLRHCHEAEIATMCYTPMARMTPELVENEMLLEIAKKHGKTVSQIVMRWNIQHGRIPIPASKSQEHIRENFDVFDFSLLNEEMFAIDTMECGMRVRYDPKKRFGTKQKLRFLAQSVLKR